MNQPTTHFYEFAPFRLDPVKRLLSREGELIPLKSKDFELLLWLVEHSGQVLSKNELMANVWRDTVVEESNLSVHIFALRRALGETPDDHNYIVTVPGRGYSFVAEVTRSTVVDWQEGFETPGSKPAGQIELEPVGGAILPWSRFYVFRDTDEKFQTAINRGESIVLVKGARQVGKTSLLARSMHHARESGAQVVLTDFQQLNESHLASADSLLKMLAKSLSSQLSLTTSPDQVWDADLGPSMNFTNYMRRQILGDGKVQVVWGLDEIDRLFNRPFGSEIFGLFRSWHNARSLDPSGPLHRLTLAMAYATEANLFITDVNQSPFNVGTRLLLEDFTIEQVKELNIRYMSPLTEAEVERLYGLAGGHPYLVRCALHEVSANSIGFDQLEITADHDEGPFGSHLRRLLLSVRHDEEICKTVRGIIIGEPCRSADNFYRLRSAGVLTGDSPENATFRCELYEKYLKLHII